MIPSMSMLKGMEDLPNLNGMVPGLFYLRDAESNRVTLKRLKLLLMKMRISLSINGISISTYKR